jgi:glutaminyl-tRNA synthetase
MPTICGFRRRGYTPSAIRRFSKETGVTKFNGVTDLARLENCLRDELNKTAPRRMAVLEPLKVVITNYPDDAPDDLLDAVNNPENPDEGTRQVPFSKVIYIEQNDFMEDPPKKFFRLGPGREVRLRYAYFITCRDFVKDDDGKITELHCTYDPATRGGSAPDGRKVKGTLHWVSAEHALEAEVRVYDNLFVKEDPNDVDEGGDWKDNLNPESLTVMQDAKLEPSLSEARAGENYQFERLGYFCVDSKDSTADAPVFNRTVSLKDSWAKQKKRGG